MLKALQNANDFMREMLVAKPGQVRESFDEVTRTMQALGFGRGWPIFGVVFVPQSQEAQLIPIWEHQVSARSRVVERFLRDRTIRPLFGFTSDEEQLILGDPFLKSSLVCGGRINGLSLVAVARLDGFAGDEFPNGYFCHEANTGAPAGMDYHDVIGDTLWGTPVGEALRARFQLQKFAVRRALAETALRYFEVWNRSQKVSKPKVAIVIGTENDREVRLVAEAVGESVETYGASVSDPRWNFDGSFLHLGLKEVGILIRTSSADVEQLAGMGGPVVDALREGNVLAIPTLSGRPGGNKVCDHLLSCQPELFGLTTAERQAVRSIPPTWVVGPENIAWAREQQDILVIKANLGGGGQDCPGGRGIPLTFGSGVSQEEWGRLVELAAQSDTRRYVVQQVGSATRNEFVSVQNGVAGQYEVACDLDPYIMAGRFVGYAARGIPNPPEGEPVKHNVGDGVAHSGCIYTIC